MNNYSEPGQALPFKEIFELQPGLMLILAPDLTIRAATDAYLRETLTTRAQIVGQPVLKVFPDNAHLPGYPLSHLLGNSLQLVLTHKKPHQMATFRYDIADPTNPATYLERYWCTSNTPVLDAEGAVRCIIHETLNVTATEKAQHQLIQSQAREREALAQATLQRVRLERLFAQAPAALAILEGPDLVYKVVNKGYQELFPGRELLGKPLFTALPELIGQPIENIIRQVYATGETFEARELLVPIARYQHQAPEDIYWSFIYQAQYDASGQINGVLIFALDVTNFVEARQQVEKSAAALQNLNRELEERVTRRTQELQKARAEADQQKQQFENLFLNAPAPICILSGPQLIFDLVNPSFNRLFPGRQLAGRPVLEALPEIEHNHVYQSLCQVYTTGITHTEKEVLVPLYRPEDQVLENRYFRYVQQPRYHEDGEINGVLVYAFEVTDQVQARQAIEASAAQLRLVTDALPVLIGYLDKEEKYQFANKAYEQWFNQNPQHLLGQPVRGVVGEKAYHNVKAYIDRALAGERLDFEATMPYRQDLIKYIRTSYVPDWQDGQVAGFYTLVTDITDQVNARLTIETSEQQASTLAAELARANEELWVANQEIRSANEELAFTNQQLKRTNVDLDNFIYTASHDLKTPIINIEALVQALKEDLPPACLQNPATSYTFDLIQDSVRRFKRTIEHLTEITKLQKEHNSEELLVDLAGLVSEVQLDLANAIQAARAQVIVQIPPQACVRFSEKNLRSMVYNLLSNAVKYHAPERPPFIVITGEQTPEYFILSVQDNGLGINLIKADKLFGMFQRLHSHVEGSGIGLYMVKKIIENAGGKIEVASEVGQGSQFRLYFPQ